VNGASGDIRVDHLDKNSGFRGIAKKETSLAAGVTGALPLKDKPSYLAVGVLADDTLRRALHLK
jgi:hypothetical protein